MEKIYEEYNKHVNELNIKHIEDKQKDFIKFQCNIMLYIINTIEYLNNRFDPFDINLDGWGENVSKNIGEYEVLFRKLNEKLEKNNKVQQLCNVKLT